jgi:hypothetical protein
MKTTAPSMTIVNILDPRREAWIDSRPTFDHSDIDMEEIHKMDLAINSMAMYCLRFDSSLWFRDILFSLRPIAPWARSLRATPMTWENLSVSSECDWGEEGIIRALDEMYCGVPQDSARVHIPLSLSTSYMAVLNFRTIAAFYKTLREFGNDRIQVYADLIEQAIPECRDSLVKPIFVEYCVTSDEKDIDGVLRCGSKVVINRDMKGALMSQFLRQHHSSVKTTLWNQMSSYGENEISQNDEINVTCYAEAASYDKMMSLRSHWFADWAPDMWGGVVGDYIENMSPEEFWNFIPNGASGRDPYSKDLLARVRREDPNPPCPIECEAPYLLEVREFLRDNDPRMIKAYAALIDAGYINDNPNNELRRIYEKAS